MKLLLASLASLAVLLAGCTATTTGDAKTAPLTYTEVHDQYLTAAKSIATEVHTITGLDWYVIKDSWQACPAGRKAIIDIEFTDSIKEDDWQPSLEAVRKLAWLYGAHIWLPLEDGMGNHIYSMVGGGPDDVKIMFGSQVRAMVGVDSPCGVVES